MTVTGLIINQEKDTAAVVAGAVKKGDVVLCRRGGKIIEIPALEDIPIYHKISLKNMKKGEAVIKYGEAIGRLLEDVGCGGYIHIHNLGRMEEREKG